MPYVAFVAVAESRRGMHLPLSTATIESIIQRPSTPKDHKPLNIKGFNKPEPNGTTFALNFLKACRVKAMGQGRFR
jgi:hypothetical protein